jgi:hypothetical protein
MSQLQRRALVSCFFLALASSSGSAKAQPKSEQALRSGFVLAQACEGEIDDDMASYEECIGHAIDRVTAQRHVILGIHFQAWLMADLAARQNGSRALILRKRHARGMNLQMKATQVTLNQLCQAKQISCANVRLRMNQTFE